MGEGCSVCVCVCLCVCVCVLKAGLGRRASGPVVMGRSILACVCVCVCVCVEGWTGKVSKRACGDGCSCMCVCVCVCVLCVRSYVCVYVAGVLDTCSSALQIPLMYCFRRDPLTQNPVWREQQVPGSRPHSPLHSTAFVFSCILCLLKRLQEVCCSFRGLKPCISVPGP